MKKPCTSQFVRKMQRKAHSWRKAAQELNEIYGVNLPHLTWRDYATGRRDIINPTVRAALLVGPGEKIKAHFLRLLERMNPKDLNRWRELRKQKKYKAANIFLDEVYLRPITKAR